MNQLNRQHFPLKLASKHNSRNRLRNSRLGSNSDLKEESGSSLKRLSSEFHIRPDHLCVEGTTKTKFVRQLPVSKTEQVNSPNIMSPTNNNTPQPGNPKDEGFKFRYVHSFEQGDSRENLQKAVLAKMSSPSGKKLTFSGRAQPPFHSFVNSLRQFEKPAENSKRKRVRDKSYPPSILQYLNDFTFSDPNLIVTGKSKNLSDFLSSETPKGPPPPQKANKEAQPELESVLSMSQVKGVGGGIVSSSRRTHPHLGLATPQSMPSSSSGMIRTRPHFLQPKGEISTFQKSQVLSLKASLPGSSKVVDWRDERVSQKNPDDFSLTQNKKKHSQPLYEQMSRESGSMMMRSNQKTLTKGTKLIEQTGGDRTPDTLNIFMDATQPRHTYNDVSTIERNRNLQNSTNYDQSELYNVSDSKGGKSSMKTTMKTAKMMNTNKQNQESGNFKFIIIQQNQPQQQQTSDSLVSTQQVKKTLPNPQKTTQNSQGLSILGEGLSTHRMKLKEGISNQQSDCDTLRNVFSSNKEGKLSLKNLNANKLQKSDERQDEQAHYSSFDQSPRQLKSDKVSEKGLPPKGRLRQLQSDISFGINLRKQEEKQEALGLKKDRKNNSYTSQQLLPDSSPAIRSYQQESIKVSGKKVRNMDSFKATSNLMLLSDREASVQKIRLLQQNSSLVGSLRDTVGVDGGGASTLYDQQYNSLNKDGFEPKNPELSTEAHDAEEKLQQQQYRVLSTTRNMMPTESQQRSLIQQHERELAQQNMMADELLNLLNQEKQTEYKNNCSYSSERINKQIMRNLKIQKHLSKAKRDVMQMHPQGVKKQLHQRERKPRSRSPKLQTESIRERIASVIERTEQTLRGGGTLDFGSGSKLEKRAGISEVGGGKVSSWDGHTSDSKQGRVAEDLSQQLHANIQILNNTDSSKVAETLVRVATTAPAPLASQKAEGNTQGIPSVSAPLFSNKTPMTIEKDHSSSPIQTFLGEVHLACSESPMKAHKEAILSPANPLSPKQTGSFAEKRFGLTSEGKPNSSHSREVNHVQSMSNHEEDKENFEQQALEIQRELNIIENLQFIKTDNQFNQEMPPLEQPIIPEVIMTTQSLHADNLSHLQIAGTKMRVSPQPPKLDLKNISKPNQSGNPVLNKKRKTKHKQFHSQVKSKDNSPIFSPPTTNIDLAPLDNVNFMQREYGNRRFYQRKKTDNNMDILKIPQPQPNSRDQTSNRRKKALSKASKHSFIGETPKIIQGTYNELPDSNASALSNYQINNLQYHHSKRYSQISSTNNPHHQSILDSAKFSASKKAGAQLKESPEPRLPSRNNPLQVKSSNFSENRWTSVSKSRSPIFQKSENQRETSQKMGDSQVVYQVMVGKSENLIKGTSENLTSDNLNTATEGSPPLFKLQNKVHSFDAIPPEGIRSFDTSMPNSPNFQMQLDIKQRQKRETPPPEEEQKPMEELKEEEPKNSKSRNQELAKSGFGSFLSSKTSTKGLPHLQKRSSNASSQRQAKTTAPSRASMSLNTGFLATQKQLMESSAEIMKQVKLLQQAVRRQGSSFRPSVQQTSTASWLDDKMIIQTSNYDSPQVEPSQVSPNYQISMNQSILSKELRAGTRKSSALRGGLSLMERLLNFDHTDRYSQNISKRGRTFKEQVDLDLGIRTKRNAMLVGPQLTSSSSVAQTKRQSPTTREESPTLPKIELPKGFAASTRNRSQDFKQIHKMPHYKMLGIQNMLQFNFSKMQKLSQEKIDNQKIFKQPKFQTPQFTAAMQADQKRSQFYQVTPNSPTLIYDHLATRKTDSTVELTNNTQVLSSTTLAKQSPFATKVLRASPVPQKKVEDIKLPVPYPLPQASPVRFNKEHGSALSKLSVGDKLGLILNDN